MPPAFGFGVARHQGNESDKQDQGFGRIHTTKLGENSSAMVTLLILEWLRLRGEFALLLAHGANVQHESE
jgi:hypothetical protein